MTYYNSKNGGSISLVGSHSSALHRRITQAIDHLNEAHKLRYCVSAKLFDLEGAPRLRKAFREHNTTRTGRRLGLHGFRIAARIDLQRFATAFAAATPLSARLFASSLHEAFSLRQNVLTINCNVPEYSIRSARHTKQDVWDWLHMQLASEDPFSTITLKSFDKYEVSFEVFSKYPEVLLDLAPACLDHERIASAATKYMTFERSIDHTLFVDAIPSSLRLFQCTGALYNNPHYFDLTLL